MDEVGMENTELEQYNVSEGGEANESLETNDASTLDDNATEEQTPVNDFDPNKWGYKYRGQMIYPKDRDHLITLAQQGHMASQRMAEINKRAQEMESLQQQLGQYKQLDEIFQKNPKFSAKIWELYQRSQAGENVLEDGDENGLGAIVQKVQGVESKLQKWEQEKEDQALQRDIEALKNNHKDHDWDTDDGEGTLEKRILKHAYDNGFPTLESAYRDMMFDNVRTNAEAEALKKSQQNRLAEKKAGIIEKNSSGSRPAPKNNNSVRGMNYNQIAEAAIQGL